MTGGRFDVSVTWKRPYWPGTLAIIVLDLCLLPFSGQGGIALQIFGLGIVLLWMAFVMFIAEPWRRKRRGQDAR